METKYNKDWDSPPILEFLNEKDKLFKEGDFDQTAAGIKPKRDFYTYANAYRAAGDLIIKNINDGHDRDELVYPIIFLYRHCIELNLKDLYDKYICGYCEGKIEKRSWGGQGGHNLVDLWDECEKILKRIFPNDKRTFDAIGKRMFEFDRIDKGGQAFRYPTNTNGENPLPNLEQVDLKNQSEVIDDIFCLLDSIKCEILAWSEIRAEESYHRCGSMP